MDLTALSPYIYLYFPNIELLILGFLICCCFFLQDNDASKPESVMESNVDAAEWKLEVERVLPLLKVHIRTDNKVCAFLH